MTKRGERDRHSLQGGQLNVNKIYYLSMSRPNDAHNISSPPTSGEIKLKLLSAEFE